MASPRPLDHHHPFDTGPNYGTQSADLGNFWGEMHNGRRSSGRYLSSFLFLFCTYGLDWPKPLLLLFRKWGSVTRAHALLRSFFNSLTGRQIAQNQSEGADADVEGGLVKSGVGSGEKRARYGLFFGKI